MTDNTNPDNHAEVAALQHEIYTLHKMLDEKEQQHIAAMTPKRGDPFGNPTEYSHFRGDYAEILPEICEPGFEIPLEPEYPERRRLKKCYAAGGRCLLMRFFMADWFATALILLSLMILAKLNPDADSRTLMTYMKGSAIFAAINMLVALIVNVFTSVIGLKMSGEKLSSLFKPRYFGFGEAVQYCLISVFLLLVSVISSNFIEEIASKFGTTTDTLDLDGVAVTTLGATLMGVYRCIIAPVTEELFFRGMLLKAFSRANQRFAVFATAVFFGLAHANVPQFLLAFITGIFLAHITLKHDSIIPAIIVHIFVNSFTGFISLFDTDSRIYALLNTLFLLLAMVGAVMLLIFRFTDKLPATTPKQSFRGAAVAMTTFSVLFAFVLEVLYTLSFIFDNRFFQILRMFV